ncbi:hypothetical protein [Pseudoalteromonas luteoviolacea]|uniref:Uncharacterized protein n=1 Tax=Pseudoalteromonas luteoviolacea NCIMB 1942 TaxID=1365253 RepID=A0A166Z5Z5_9GAMM|nr:hypothetical protein [Pseudoalteromonas luteoviolacea]KZN43970.1 hypothetical protein N482_18225 [Pseudoalteromonas luteoviolacea NCIMB 1942]
MMPELPFVSGEEDSGTVSDKNGSALKKGQRVAYLGPIGSSMYAQYTVVDADKLIVLDDEANLLEADAMPVTYFAAYHIHA